MNGSRNCHAESSKWDGEGEISYDIPDMWNLKKWYKWTYLQNRNWFTNIDNKLLVNKGESGEWGKDKLGIWD